MKFLKSLFLPAIAPALIVVSVGAAPETVNTLPATLAAQIDEVARNSLHELGAPGASVAIVTEGKIAYVKAYGHARLEPRVESSPAMRYSIGSVSKQFIAAAALLLVEEKKMSLEDPVSRWFPDLPRASDVTVRHLLSHTSGYQDYWPQDYLMAPMVKSTTPEAIIDTWARLKPVDFEPGTQSQYSNTNYVIVARIIEAVSGAPVMQFMRDRLFRPLGMTEVLDINTGTLGDTDATGYVRYALGPLRLAPNCGTGWVYAACGLAMTARELAVWNISVLKQTLLRPESYREMMTDVRLKNGAATTYGFGFRIDLRARGHRTVAHGGEVPGFVTENLLLPDDGIAVTVLVNQEAVRAAKLIGGRIVDALLRQAGSEMDEGEKLAARIFAGLQEGRIDRALFTPNCNGYFGAQTLADFSSSLKPLGKPTSFEQTYQAVRGGMMFRDYAVKFGSRSVRVTTRAMPDGKFEQYQVMP